MEFKSLSCVALESLRWPKLVSLKDGEYSLDTGRGRCTYDFSADRCRTPEELLAWVLHLSEKTWFTTEHVRQLVELAASQGVDVAFNC